MITLLLVVINLIETMIIAAFIIESSREDSSSINEDEVKEQCKCPCSTCHTQNHEACTYDCEAFAWTGYDT